MSTLDPIQFSDGAKPNAAFPERNRTLSNHDVECLLALGFDSAASVMASLALRIDEVNDLKVKVRGLESALEERRFHQSQHLELRDQWAMQAYQKDGRTFEQSYVEADKAMTARLTKAI